MEDSLRIVGEYGIYQTHIKIILLGCAFLTNIFSLQIDLMLKIPNIKIIEKNFPIKNSTIESLLPNHEKIDNKFCDKNKYDIEIYENTTLKNWNYNYELFCENEWYLYCIYFSVLIGNIFGLIFFSSIGDRIGREKIIKYSIIFNSFVHLNLLFCINLFHLVLINFLGSLNSFIFIISIVCITEILPHESNGINIGIFNLVYNSYLFVLYFFLSFFEDWKILFFFTSLMSIFLSYYTFHNFLESPRWLYSIGQKIKCLSVLDRISLYNGTLTTWNEYQDIQIENANRFGRASTNFTKLFNFELDCGEIEQDFKGITFFDLFTFKSQKNILIILGFLIFISAFYSCGILIIIINKENNDNIHTLILIWFFKIIIGMIAGYFSDILGRKPLIMFGGIFGSFCLFIYVENGSELFLIMSLLCSQGVCTILLIYVPENISTPIRCTLCGWLFLEYKVIKFIIEISYKYINKDIMNYFIILSGFLIGFCMIYMKETLDENISDIIPELKDKIEKFENFHLKSFHSTEYPSFLIA